MAAAQSYTTVRLDQPALRCCPSHTCYTRVPSHFRYTGGQQSTSCAQPQLSSPSPTAVLGLLHHPHPDLDQDSHLYCLPTTGLHLLTFTVLHPQPELSASAAPRHLLSCPPVPVCAPLLSHSLSCLPVLSRAPTVLSASVGLRHPQPTASCPIPVYIFMGHQL